MKLQGLLLNILSWFFIGIIISIFLEITDISLSSTGAIFIDLGLIFLFSYLIIYIHEFGHAIAGWLVGFPIKKITIGLGKNIWKYKIKATSTWIVINNGFQGGLTHLGDVSRDFLRPKFFIFAGGGIAIQSLAVFFCLYINNQLSFNPFFHSLLDLFIYTNIFIIIFNLLPYNTQAFGIPRPTDGLLMLTIFFMKEDKIREILISGKVLDGLEYLEEKKLAEAELVFRDCVEKSPLISLPKINLAVALIRQQKIDEAIKILEQLIENNQVKGIQLALVYNNIAWSYLIKSTKEKEALIKADEYCQKGLKVNQQIPHLQGTRSCILIEMNQLEEGIKILKPMAKLNQPINEMTNSVIAFLYLAYGYYRQENWLQASKYWQKIKQNQDLNSTEYSLLLQYILHQTNNFENTN